MRRPDSKLNQARLHKMGFAYGRQGHEEVMPSCDSGVNTIRFSCFKRLKYDEWVRNPFVWDHDGIEYSIETRPSIRWSLVLEKFLDELLRCTEATQLGGYSSHLWILFEDRRTPADQWRENALICWLVASDGLIIYMSAEAGCDLNWWDYPVRRIEPNE